MERLFVQQLDRQYARLDKERLERERLEKERQEKLLAIVSSFLYIIGTYTILAISFLYYSIFGFLYL